ncbi:sulfotransferase family protein [Nocardioides aequoreus]|uniref:sulfotransferase-like domain-containing protein n=1 Tax=Nocardioides aequoreus TaxID=397278 RepID=UPI00068A9C2D|nr:sulfotransferase family protein [Nocardioides aequoreus]
MSYPVIVLWSVPRSVSTSFERMVSERGDHTVLDEPFSRAYYFGPDRHSQRYAETIPHSAAREVLEEIEEAAEERPVFVKDMAYHAVDLLEADVLGRFRNSFLVRHPSGALRSLARRWPDFTDAETGWPDLGRAADVVEEVGQPLVVVDANRLCDDPDAVVERWCERIGLDHRPETLTWEPGMRPEWELWEEWHASTSRTTGFGTMSPPPSPPGDDEPRLQEAYADALPVYERLVAHAL